jgi:ferritin-like metal-binding protein YciE
MTPTMIDTDDSAQLEAARALVLQYLHEAHATELALVTTLTAHISMTPRGAYRTLLERHLRETQAHAQAVQERIGEIGDGVNVVQHAVGLVQTVVGQVLSLSKGPIDMLRGATGEEKLLKNARDECATEALEIATYDSIEAAARAVGDEKTAQLAVRHRADEERMLAGLREQIPALTTATVRERVGGEAIYDPGTTGAADALRGRNGDLPIAGYDTLNAGQVIKRLPRLSQDELQAVERYERAHRNRKTVLAKIEALKAGG